MLDRRLRVVRRGADGRIDDAIVLEALDDRTIEVRIGAEDPHTALAAETAVDLLGRLFPRIAVTGHADSPRFEAARRHGMEPRTPRSPTVVLHVGPGGADADLHVDGTGWQGYIGTMPSQLHDRCDDPAVVGPLTAASRAAAHVYLLALHDLVASAAPPKSSYWSGLDFTTGPSPLTVTAPAWEPHLNAVLAGAGSIGGAAVYAWARTRNLRGALDIVDPQYLEPTNPDRALLAIAAASERREAKAMVAMEALNNVPGLTVQGHVTDLDGFVAERPRTQTLPLTLCAVDSVAARRAVQDSLPMELINAACDPTNSVVSGHRTGAGPCVLCLFMGRILDREQALFRLIARATALNERMVAGMMATRAPLNRQHIRGVEDYRGLPRGALGDYEGRTLRELWNGELLYGAHRVTTQSGGVVAVAAPWVTSLSGFLLASEALKHVDVALRRYCLGPAGVAGRYVESVYGAPQFAQLTSPARWSGDECLCNSPRRRRLMLERYAVSPDEYPI